VRIISWLFRKHTTTKSRLKVKKMAKQDKEDKQTPESESGFIGDEVN